MKKRIYISASIALAVIIALYFIFVGKRGPAYNFKFDTVSQGDLTVYVTATGTINAVTSVDVGTQVSGIVSKLYADFNSIVKKGQIIAQIDSTFLVQSIKDAEANLEKAQAQYADSKRNLDRSKTLFERGLDSQLNYDATLTTYESNAAALKSAQSALDRAKINLSYSTIYAPINGVVINRAVNVGQTVAASFSSPTLFTIANDLKKMQVQTTVDETDIGRVSVGQEATFTVDAYPDDNFSGMVTQIRLAPQSVQNVVNYIVIIDVQNDQLKLMPGMTANVKILIASVSNVVRVSNMALRFQPPADIIDTAGTGSSRSDFMSKADNITDAAKFSGSSIKDGNNRFSKVGREQMQFVRDSIQAAHGGKLSEDELRNETRKLFTNRMNINTPAQQNVQKVKIQKQADKYGIISNYPEYQKSAYVPSKQSGKGKIWILKSNGRLESVFVRTGLNDGRYTEISSSRLKPGDQVVVGAASNGDSGTSQTRSPLTGSGQQPRGGGGPR
jgi:HlyD family secretion protein